MSNETRALEERLKILEGALFHHVNQTNNPHSTDRHLIGAVSKREHANLQELLIAHHEKYGRWLHYAAGWVTFLLMLAASTVFREYFPLWQALSLGAVTTIFPYAALTHLASSHSKLAKAIRDDHRYNFLNQR